MEHEEEAICLAKTAHGFVKICPQGCTHVTFGRVTLHFESPGQFQDLAEEVGQGLAELGEGQHLLVSHYGFMMELTAQFAFEFYELIREAAAALAWSHGEMKFTDDDFQQILRRFPTDG